MFSSVLALQGSKMSLFSEHHNMSVCGMACGVLSVYCTPVKHQITYKVTI
jgi:hypothetical protein